METTILVANQDLIVQPIIKAKVPYDPFKSFTPVSLAVSAPEMIVVHPSLQVKDLKELGRAAQSQSGQVQLCQSGYGTTPHLACVWLFNLENGIDVRRTVSGGGACGAVDAGRTDAGVPQRAAGGGATYPRRHNARTRGRVEQPHAVLP